MASTFVIKLLLFFAISFSNSPPIPFAMSASPSLSFSLTHRDADSSPLRSVEADPVDLPEDMPMRAFVAAGRALRTRVSLKREQELIMKAKGVAPSLLGRRISYGELPLRGGEFYITVSVGTPPQKMIWLPDTGSEFSWLECSPCSSCSSTTAPRFAYNRSSSFQAVSSPSSLCTGSVGYTRVPSCDFTAASPAHSCFFSVSYTGGAEDCGFVSVDTFDLSSRLISKPFVFGCAVIVKEQRSASHSGLLGLDAGPYSFTSQLFSSTSPRMPKKFAYWLPSRFESLNASGKIVFGDYKRPRGMRYTPLAPPFSPMGASFYYVNLQGITVGKRLIKADNMGPNNVLGGGGTIFDSGSALSYLKPPLYGKLVEEMMRQTAHLRPFNASNTTLESDLCYKLPMEIEKLPDVPQVIMHFARGVDLELEAINVFYGDFLPSDNANFYFCLAFRSSSDNENTIGNHQGQNYWVEYNLETLSLGLAKASIAHL